MKKNKFFNKIKFLVLLFAIKFFTITSTLSEQLKSINIEGNERLADETIILFSNLVVGENIDSNTINNTFKNLFDTDYFKDLKIIYFETKLINISMLDLIMQTLILLALLIVVGWVLFRPFTKKELNRYNDKNWPDMNL